MSGTILIKYHTKFHFRAAGLFFWRAGKAETSCWLPDSSINCDALNSWLPPSVRGKGGGGETCPSFKRCETIESDVEY